MLGLDENGETDLLRCCARLGGGLGVLRLRYVHAGRRSSVELGALALDLLEDVPVRKRGEYLEIAEVLRNQIQLLVMRRKDDDLAKRADRRDESSRVGVRVGTDEPFRVARSE